MKFYCLLPVRDEEDIIEQCLATLLEWSDGIFVFDTGSTDRTWDIVMEFSARGKKIHPLGKDDVYYSEPAVRGFIFHKARSFMKDGDWFLRVDADEFHHITPPEFVEQRMKKHETIAYHQYYNFELTDKEAAALSNPESVYAERERPIQERRRFYTVSKYSEPRLCRYRTGMKWPVPASFPFHAGFVAKERLPILHYPNRDPLQMERRCYLRSMMLADKENKLNWSGQDIHWTISDWQQFVISSAQPGLRYLAPRTSLEEVRDLSHLAPGYKRLAQRLVHSWLLPMLDKMHNDFSKDSYPKKLSPDVIALLHQDHSPLMQGMAYHD